MRALLVGGLAVSAGIALASGMIASMTPARWRARVGALLGRTTTMPCTATLSGRHKPDLRFKNRCLACGGRLDDIEPSVPYQAHSETSKAAAESVTGNTATYRARVLACLRAEPDGLTDEEMQEALGMNPSTQRPRRIELIKAGSVRDSGRKRRTRSGREAVVWVAVPDRTLSE